MVGLPFPKFRFLQTHPTPRPEAAALRNSGYERGKKPGVVIFAELSEQTDLGT